MIFTPTEIQNILQIIDYHTTFVISTQIGTDVLNNNDKDILKRFGVNWQQLTTKYPPYYQMYLWGRLSGALSNYQAGQVNYSDFKKYIGKGQYIPLSRREKNELEIAKNISVGHIKLFQSRIKDSVSHDILEEDSRRRLEYEKVFKKEIERGIVDRKSIQSIISEIGNKTGKWNYDWNRLIDTECNNIFQRGRAQTLIDKYGEDTLVYKNVYPGACQECIRLYLTKGIGSQPILFKLSDLIDNGSNVGRKRKDWKATLDGIHSFCRCTLIYVPNGYEWNDETQKFEPPKEFKRKVERKSKIKIQVGDKEFYT